MLTEPTLEKLRAMRLSGMAEALLEQKQQAGARKLDFDERLGLLVDAEYLHRQNRQQERRLREAKLRQSQASLEDFDAPLKRGLDLSLLRELMRCQWIDEHQNILITGLTGVGKTYFACALGQLACRRGNRVLYRRTPRFLDELTMARADGTLPRLLAKLARFDLLILDDWGLAKLRDQDRRDLLEVIDDRDAARSTVLASQIPVEKWHDYLGDPTIADAISDRLLHGAHRIVLKGPSKRKPRKETAKKEE
jgi:DNA replication protein DnaC